MSAWRFSSDPFLDSPESPHSRQAIQRINIYRSFSNFQLMTIRRGWYIPWIPQPKGQIVLRLLHWIPYFPRSLTSIVVCLLITIAFISCLSYLTPLAVFHFPSQPLALETLPWGQLLEESRLCWLCCQNFTWMTTMIYGWFLTPTRILH